MKSVLLVVMFVLAALLPLVAEETPPEKSFGKWVESDHDAFKQFKQIGVEESTEPTGRATPGTSATEVELRALCGALDDQQRGATLADKAFALTLFQQILGDNPSQLVLGLMESMLKGDWHDKDCIVRVPRSGLLALLLMAKADGDELSVAVLREYLPLIRSLELDTQPRWAPPRAAPAPPPSDSPKPLAARANTGQYKLYYGYFHAHTSLSDGKGKPSDAFSMARDDVGLDFFAVTDHASLVAFWPWDAKWKRTRKTADKFNEDGRFVALAGFEWSSPMFGHVNVLGTRSFTTAVTSPTMADLYQWIGRHPESVCRFNHPGYADKLKVEFDHFALSHEAVNQMVGVEMFNKQRGIQHFFTRGYRSGWRHLDEAIGRGWFVGVVGGQDNHKRNWGKRNDCRVGAWATSLTREGILDAYRARRTFATEDGNLCLSFTANGAEMGSRLQPGAMTFQIRIEDGDNEGLSRAQLYERGALFKEWPLGSASANVTVTDASVAGDYYYVLAEQADRDTALSSPIWIVAGE